MKNSAWYQKLWERKLNERSIVDDSDKAWLLMKDLLDKNMPIEQEADKPEVGTIAAKSITAKVVSWLTYVLPAAAMIYCVTFIINTNESQKVKQKMIKTKELSRVESNTRDLTVDSFARQHAYRNKKIEDFNPVVATTTVGKGKTSAGIRYVNEQNKEPEPLPRSKKQLPAFEHLYSSAPTTIEIQKADSYQAVQLAKTTIANSSSEKSKTMRIKDNKEQRVKIKRPKSKVEMDISKYSYGINVGINTHKNPTLYFGVFGTAKISKRMTANAALLLHTSRSFTGTYTRPSYFRPDSSAAFTFTDYRKVAVLELPLTLSYHITNRLKVSGGPVISFSLKQSAIKLGAIELPRDTLFNGKQVIDIITNTKANKVNYGFKAGVGIQLNALGIDVNYQMLTPYQFKNSLGTNKPSYNNFQLGLSYRLSRK